MDALNPDATPDLRFLNIVIKLRMKKTWQLIESMVGGEAGKNPFKTSPLLT